MSTIRKIDTMNLKTYHGEYVFKVTVMRKHRNYYIMKAVTENVARFNPEAEIIIEAYYTYISVYIVSFEEMIVPEWWLSSAHSNIEMISPGERKKGSDGRDYRHIRKR
jgi:hypothetical protein